MARSRQTSRFPLPTKTAKRASMPGIPEPDHEIGKKKLSKSEEAWKTTRYRFNTEMCQVLKIDPNETFTCDEIKKLFKENATSKNKMTIIDNGSPRTHSVYTFEDEISEYLNKRMTEKFGMTAKMTFISRIIYDIISVEKIRDKWSNFNCAVKILNTEVESLEVIV